MSTSSEDVLAAFAGYAAATRQPSSADRPVKLAVVDPSYTSGWPKVTFEGESTLSGKLYPFLDSYSPSPSDRVVLVPVGSTWLIIGAIRDSGGGLPPGSIQMFAASTPPTGWLLCDGSAVSRTTYARLFAAIGTTWGVGDGSSTFNLPDLQGRTPVGVGAGSGLTSRALADTGGAEAHTTTAAHTHTGPSHTHTGPSHTHTGPSHTHTGPSHTHTGPSHTHSGPSHDHTVSTTTGTNNEGTVLFTATDGGSVGGNAAVRVGADSGRSAAYFQSSGSNFLGEHHHNLSTTTSSDGTGATGSGGTGATGSGGTGTTGSGGAGATGSGGTGTTSADGTGATGSTGSASVDHMPPFAAVTHIIRT
jgi:microcystin-dependent protein